MPWLSGSDNWVYEMNTQALRNVQRLRISRFLTCVALRELLGRACATVKMPSRQYVYGCGDWEMFAKTSWLSFGRGNGKQALIDEYRPTGRVTWDDPGSDPLQDIKDFMAWRDEDPIVRDWGGKGRRR